MIKLRTRQTNLGPVKNELGSFLGVLPYLDYSSPFIAFSLTSTYGAKYLNGNVQKHTVSVSG